MPAFIPARVARRPLQRSEAAFDVHAELSNTLAFVAAMQQLIDHPFDANRTVEIG